MPENKIILWKHRLSDKLPDGHTPDGVQDRVNDGEILHKDLGTLIAFCRFDGRQWSFAKVECGKNDVRIVPDSPRWYIALKPIPAQNGFMPLEETEKIYQNYLTYP